MAISAMSHVHRLRICDRIFFITVNVRRLAAPLTEGEYALVVDALAASPRKLHFFLYLHWNPVRKGLVAKPGDWRWSSYPNFARDKRVVASCPTRIDDVEPPESYRA